MFTIALVVLSLISIWALMTRFDRFMFALSKAQIWASVVTGVQLVLDVSLTVGVAMGASAVMGVIQGGPIGIFIGLLFSMRIEKWYNKADVLISFRKDFSDAQAREADAKLGDRQEA